MKTTPGIHRLTADQQDLLLSYQDGEFGVRRETGWSLDQLTEAALYDNIERCPGCRIWCESSDLVDDDGTIDGFCCNCRPAEGGE
jgi:hypothetical protein